MSRDGEWLPVFDGYPGEEIIRGHVPHEQAVETLISEGEDWASVEGTTIVHTYLRCVPTPNGEHDGVYLRTKKGFGAFPATLVSARRPAPVGEEAK